MITEMASELDNPDEDEVEVAEPKKQGIQRNWNTADEWDGHDYAAVPVPPEDGRPTEEWSTKERRAFLLKKIKEHGTWQNVPETQQEMANVFDVSQPAIHKDVEELRRYIRFHAGNKAISMTEMVTQKAVTEMLDEDSDHHDPFKAGQMQLDYMEFLFDLGRIDKAPDKKQVHQINEERVTDSLDPDEKEQFEKLDEMFQQASDDQHIDPEEAGEDDVVDVDFEEVDE